MALRYLLGHTSVSNPHLVLRPMNGFWALLNHSALSSIPACSSSSTSVLIHGSPFGGTCIYRGAHKDDWIIRLAQFAVEQHNNKESEHLRYVRVVGASHTMVSSMLYHITLEAVDVNKPRMYYAVVWLQMIKNFMELLVWKPVNDRFSVLGVKCGDLKLHEAVMFYMNHIQRHRFPH